VDGGELPRFSFEYRDQALIGTLRLRAKRPALTARVLEQVTLDKEQGTVAADLDFEPVSGQPDFVDLFLSHTSGAHANGDGWTAHDDANSKALRLTRRWGPETTGAIATLSASTPLGLAALLHHVPRGSTYRLHFGSGLSKAARVTLKGQFTPAPTAHGSEVFGFLKPGLSWPEALFASHRLAGGTPRLWDVPLVHVLGADHVHAVARSPR
jgi:hypothetical protein